MFRRCYQLRPGSGDALLVAAHLSWAGRVPRRSVRGDATLHVIPAPTRVVEASFAGDLVRSTRRTDTVRTRTGNPPDSATAERLRLRISRAVRLSRVVQAAVVAVCLTVVGRIGRRAASARS